MTVWLNLATECTEHTGFRQPYQGEDGNVCVQRINTPGTSLYRPQIFHDGIKFHIENGQTNCIIKQILTDEAKAIEGELPTRTNLVAFRLIFVYHSCIIHRSIFTDH